MHINQFKLLTTKRFFPLLVTQFGGSLNDHVLKGLVMIFALQQITRDTMLMVATAVFLVPFLVFSIHAGVMADTHEKSRKITTVKFAELLVIVLIVFAIMSNQLWLMLLAIFAMGCKVAYFLPLKHSILPQLVSAEELIGSNAFMNITSFLSAVIGVVVYLHFGVYPLAALMLAVAAIGWFASLFIKTSPALTGGEIAYDLFEQDKIIIFCLICISWFWFVGYTYLALLQDYSIKMFGTEDMQEQLSLAFFIGITLGSLIVNLISKSQIRLNLIPISLAVMLLFSTDLYFSSIYSLENMILVDLLMIGLAAGVFIVPLYATLQHRSVPIFRARNIACSSILNAKLIILSFIILLILENKHISPVSGLLVVPISSLPLLIYVVWKRV